MMGFFKGLFTGGRGYAAAQNALAAEQNYKDRHSLRTIGTTWTGSLKNHPIYNQKNL
jgi:hypothetical protein